MKLAITVNVDWFFLSHRLAIALEAVKRGWEVYIITKDTGSFDMLKSYGLHPFELEVERSGKNIAKEINVVLHLQRLYRELKPDVVHHVTLKIALYGSIAAKRASVPKVINAISGLGFNFTAERKSFTQKLILQLMKFAFKRKYYSFIFQNPEDRDMFKGLGLAEGNTSVIIKGSGVDLNEFRYSLPPLSSRVSFVLTARMLQDKGVGEFVHAAQQVFQKLPGQAQWFLIGGIDADNPAGYSETELRDLLRDSPVEWKGFQSDILSVLQSADVVVLPSYREGLPKSLVEAAAVGRPIITTDTVGCRECVEHGKNGFLVSVGDSDELADAMIKLIQDKQLRLKMGKASRQKAEREFSIKSVLDQTFALYTDES